MNRKTDKLTSRTPSEKSDAPSADAAGARRKPWWPWLLLGVVALGLRLIYVHEIRDIPYFSEPVGDAAGYIAWAEDIAGGDWIGSETFYQAPAYPYFLAVVFRLTSDHALAVRVVQATLGAAACLLLASAGCRLFSRRAGLAAGWLYACYAPAIFFDGIVQKTSLAAFLFAVVLWLFARTSARNRRLDWIALGLLVGILGLTRENALVILPVLLLWALVRQWRQGGWPRFAGAALLLAGFAMAVLPVAIRNKAVGGDFALTTVQGGPNFYIGNNPEASGRYEPLVRGHETPAFERDDAVRLAEQALGRELSGSEVSDYWFGESWAFIRAYPGAWLELLGRKTLMTLNGYEVSDVESFRIYQDFSLVLALLAPAMNFGTLLALGAAGMVFVWPYRRIAWVLYAIFAALVAGVALFFILGRYRFPLALPMALFAGLALIDGWRSYRTEHNARMAGAAAAMIVGLVLARLPMHPTERLDAMAYGNLGATYGQNGDLASARQVLERAVEQFPDSAELHYNLGMALRFMNEPGSAAEHLSQAKTLAPNMAVVDFQLAEVYEQLGRQDLALRHYREALQLDPSDAAAREAIARLTHGRSKTAAQ